MKHQYFLIGYRTSSIIESKLIDSTNENTLKEAEKEFEKRNNYQRLLQRYDLVVAETKRIYQ